MSNVFELLVTGPLRNVSIQYRNRSYIGDKVFRIIPGVDPKAKIAIYSKGAWFRNEAGIRGPGSRAKRTGFPIDWAKIAAEEYALASEVTDEDRRYSLLPFAPPLQPDIDALEFCSDKIDMSKEVRVASMVKGNTWADGYAGGYDVAGLWAVQDTTNTFINDIEVGTKAIQSISGVKPNVLLIDFATYTALKNVPAILDRIKYTQRGVLTAEILAALFDLDEVIIGEAIVNTAIEDKKAKAMASQYIWEVNQGKGMGFLFYRPEKVGLKQPAPGYQVRIPYEDGALRRATVWREPAEHQDVYEVAENTDIVYVDGALGYLYKDPYHT